MESFGEFQSITRGFEKVSEVFPGGFQKRFRGFQEDLKGFQEVSGASQRVFRCFWSVPEGFRAFEGISRSFRQFQ